MVALLEEAEEALADLVGRHDAECRRRGRRLDSPRMQPPRVTASRVVYENRWIRLHEDRTESRDGAPGLYAWVEKPPAALIVPLQDDHVWLVEQFRHPVGRRFWEFPQGAWEETPDAPAEALARGELAEETGLRAASDGAPRLALLRLRHERPALRRVARDRTRTRPAGAARRPRSTWSARARPWRAWRP